MNDAQILSPRFMFVFTGLCFIIGSVCMHLARINHSNNTIERSTELETTFAVTDVENGDEVNVFISPCQ